jgi:transposase
MTPNFERRKYTPEQRDEGIALFKARDRNGLSAQKIADQVGCTVAALYYWANNKPTKATKPAPRVLALRTADPPQSIEVRTVTHRELTRESELTPSEREELILLRAEVRRLRATLATATGLEVPRGHN